MTRAKRQYYGKCFLCGYIGSKASITRHIKKHIAEREGTTPLLWLRVTAVDSWWVDPSAFWLDLEVPAALTLDDLDQFLRDIWLECCGHLSLVSVGKGAYAPTYERYPDPNAWEKSFAMADVTVGQLADAETTWYYEYDYGSTTTLQIAVRARYNGPQPSPDAPIQVLSRNFKPFIPCEVCGKEAEYWDTETGEAFCEEHLPEELEDFALPVVNSPRTGVCAYTGPADSPKSLHLWFEEIYTPPEKR